MSGAKQPTTSVISQMRAKIDDLQEETEFLRQKYQRMKNAYDQVSTMASGRRRRARGILASVVIGSTLVVCVLLFLWASSRAYAETTYQAMAKEYCLEKLPLADVAEVTWAEDGEFVEFKCTQSVERRLEILESGRDAGRIQGRTWSTTHELVDPRTFTLCVYADGTPCRQPASK